MPDQFKHYWPLTEEEKTEVWETGVIVLDTNVYLHIYRFPPKERDRLLQILGSPKVQNRLWVPHQVAEEFYRNRLTVIGEQITAAKKLLGSSDKVMTDFFASLDDTIRKHHPLIDRDDWKESLGATIAALKTKYEAAKALYPVSMNEDPFLERVRTVMGGRIGAPMPDEEMKAIREEAKERFAKGIPPGYEDAKKDGDRAMGDLILWKQALKEMEKRKAHLVLVVDDRKEDWWLKKQGALLGPRPELRKEYREKTGKDVDFATSERFFEWATVYLNLESAEAFQEALAEVMSQTNLSRALKLHSGWKGYNLDQLGSDVPISPAKDDIATSETPDQMAEWFLENYEDPSNSVPYESAEGGYQYMNGGPYYAAEVLRENFPDADEASIQKAAAAVSEEGGPDWVRREDY